MSAETLINIAIAVVLVASGITLIRLDFQPRPSLKERIAAARARVGRGAPERQYDGPDSLRLMQDLDTHLDEYFAELSHLFEELGPPPTSAEGLAQLKRAIRDEHTKGDS